MKTANTNDKDGAPEMPEKLVAALRQSQAEAVFVPRTVDEAILRAARTHLAKETQQRFRWLPLLTWISAATAVIVAVALVFVRFRPHVARTNQALFTKEDINHDGRVDILDAFALAKRLKQGTASDPHFDVNGDGIVDERDIQIIAAESVKLSRGGRS